MVIVEQHVVFIANINLLQIVLRKTPNRRRIKFEVAFNGTQLTRSTGLRCMQADFFAARFSGSSSKVMQHEAVTVDRESAACVVLQDSQTVLFAI